MRRCTLASWWLGTVLFAACETPPNAPPLPNTIYLLGRFSAQRGRAQFAAQLRQRGYRVANDLDDGVDTLVVGAPPINDSVEGVVLLEESAEYRRAVRRNLRLLSPQEAEPLVVAAFLLFREYSAADTGTWHMRATHRCKTWIDRWTATARSASAALPGNRRPQAGELTGM